MTEKLEDRFIPCELCDEPLDLDSDYWIQDDGGVHAACVIKRSKYYCPKHYMFWFNSPSKNSLGGCESCKLISITVKLRKKLLKKEEKGKTK